MGAFVIANGIFHLLESKRKPQFMMCHFLLLLQCWLDIIPPSEIARLISELMNSKAHRRKSHQEWIRDVVVVVDQPPLMMVSTRHFVVAQSILCRKIRNFHFFPLLNTNNLSPRATNASDGNELLHLCGVCVCAPFASFMKSAIKIPIIIISTLRIR